MPWAEMQPRLSFIIPFMDEEDTLRELADRIEQAARGCLQPGESYELWFIDDGSRDRSVKIVEELVAERPEVRLLELQGNFGKSAALAAGFSEARGDVVFTLDADLQDDPKEIPRFLSKLDEGFDLVSGYKEKRNDPFTKVVPSRVFNAEANQQGLVWGIEMPADTKGVSAVAITDEPAGGSAQPTTTPFMVGAIPKVAQ